MRHLIYGIVTLVFLACSSKQKEVITPSSSVLNQNSLTWEVTGNGLTEPSYIFGTIHLIDADDFFWPNGILETFNRVKKVFFEVDLSQMNDMSAMMSLLPKTYMPDGMTIQDLLSDEDYALVEQHFVEKGLPLMLFQRMKPMFLTIFASSDMDIAGGGMQADGFKSYEFELQNEADKNNVDVDGLETLDFQLSLFDEIPYEKQAMMLVKAIQESGSESQSLEELIQLYKDENIQELYRSTTAEGSDIGEFEEILLDKRNRNWIPKMETAMRDYSCLFAVGAGHLAGEQGVLNLLLKKGYKIRPYKVTAL